MKHLRIVKEGQKWYEWLLPWHFIHEEDHGTDENDELVITLKEHGWCWLSWTLYFRVDNIRKLKSIRILFSGKINFHIIPTCSFYDRPWERTIYWLGITILIDLSQLAEDAEYINFSEY
jgi:hypothetical protein